MIERHQIVRVRREPQRRTLTVARIEAVTPRMLRLHFNSDDMAGFESLSFDDHIKVFLTVGGKAGPAPGGGERPPMRDFTPRRFDAAAGTITLDFAMHDAGPAIDWAKAATIGDTLTIGGPRGSAIVPDDFEWYWLIGDETALPAIGRRIEELRASVPVTSVVMVADAGEAQTFETAADWTGHWPLRVAGEDDAAALIAMLPALPPGDGFVWIAAEADVARAVRAYVIDQGHPRGWTKAAGYWQRGAADAHVRIED
jgi:NADPH-dependent ferric siderophore reductase